MDELDILKGSYVRLQRRFADREAERKELNCEVNALRSEHKNLLDRLEDAKQETEIAREQDKDLRNELLTLRSQVATFKYCMAVMTGTEIPVEITTKSNPFHPI